MRNKARILQRTGTAIRLLEKPLVEAAGLFMHGLFCVLAIVFHNLCDLNWKIIHENRLTFYVALENSLNWSPRRSRIGT